MAVPSRQLPRMPPIGEPEDFYAKRARRAIEAEEPIARDAWKVGQYCTLALGPKLRWDEKLPYYEHAISRHCVPPNFPDDEVWLFYRNLAAHVQQCAGKEALRLANMMDEWFSRRLAKGEPRGSVEHDAERFFLNLLPEDRPYLFNEKDYLNLTMLRDRWL